MYIRGAILVFCFSFLCFFISAAQRFGGTPSSIKWKQISTDTVRVIFPKGMDSVAQHIASVVLELQKNYGGTIGNKVKKVSIVLQNNTTVSNAYVGLGPYRSEFYLTPPQNAFELGAQSWAGNLALHEYRHVQQYSNFNVGASKAMHVLFGENGQALANAAAIPDWFFEGDAVYSETMLSQQGRGRLPQFFNAYKSLYNDNRKYSYMQLRNGSYKNFIPNHYDLGYLLVAYGREKYGDEIWKNITQDAASFKPLFYPMQGAVKKNTGVNYNQFVNDAFAFYQAQWKDDAAKKTVQWITKTQKNNVVNYRYPYMLNDGSILALKATNKEVPALTVIHIDGTENKTAVRDITYDDYFSYNNGKIIYAAYQPDVRWGNREYSTIKIVDISSGEENKITSHTKYFSPDISHDSKKILVIENTPEQKSILRLMNADGEIIRSVQSDAGHFFSYPKFSADDNFFYVVERNEKGEMAILKEAIDGGNLKEILPFANRIIGFPVVQGDTLLYTCSNNGHDEIWAYINAQDKHYKLATYTTGLYQAVLTANGQIVSSAFTSSGYRLAKLDAQWQPINKPEVGLTNLFVTKPFNEKDNSVLSSVDTRNFVVTKYPKLFKPFNFHSWNPTIDHPDYSFNIYGENVLNTLQSQLYYNYNADEKYSRVGYAATYGGWYVQPVIDISKTWKRNAQYNADTTFYWNEFNAAAGLRLPLNLSGGKQYRYLSLSATYNIDQVEYTGLAKELFNNSTVNYLQTRLTYSGQIQQAVQQIYPHWGQSFLMQYRTAVNKYTATQFLVSGSLYLPGFAKTHSIVINAAYQSRDTAREYLFSNSFPFSRGYDALNYPRMWKLGANYHLPLLYPDWGFGNIVFFNRIRANVFYDYTIGRSLRYATNYQFKTAGGELYFDTKWWNQQSLTFGIRYSRLLNNDFAGLGANQWEFILPVTILR